MKLCDPAVTMACSEGMGALAKTLAGLVAASLVVGLVVVGWWLWERVA